MNRSIIHSLIAAALAVFPALAAPDIIRATAANVTASGACLVWEFTEDAYPGLALFTDAAETNEVTHQVRVEFQALEHARRELDSTPESRAANRGLQEAMTAKRVAFIRVSGLDPETEYHFRPQALASAGGSALSSGPLLSFTTATTAAFLPEARQLAVDLSAVVPTTGPAAGAVLLATHAGSAYPLAAVVGDGPQENEGYFDLTLLLDAAGETNLTPSSGQLELSLSWLGLPPLGGYFSPGSVAYSGAPVVAALSTSSFVGEGLVVRAIPSASTITAGFPLDVALAVTDVGGQVDVTFTRPLVVSGAGLAFGAGATAALSAGSLAAHQLVFSGVGLQTVTVSDPGSGASSTFEVTVLPMTYVNWADAMFGGDPTHALSQANPDGDPFPNFIEFIHGTNPLGADQSLVGLVPPPAGKALAIRFRLNPWQTEYRVSVQLSADLAAWHPSAKEPVVLSAEPSGNLMEVSWTRAELEAATGMEAGGYFARLAWEPDSGLDAYLAAHGLSGADALPGADPDGDGRPNYVEFALDDNPSSGVGSGKIRQTQITHDGVSAQVLTVPMRLGALSTGGSSGGELVLECLADGLRYRIQGSLNLKEWTVEMTEVPAVTAGMPMLSPGYEYRSFQSAGGGREFVRVLVEKL